MPSIQKFFANSSFFLTKLSWWTLNQIAMWKIRTSIGRLGFLICPTWEHIITSVEAYFVIISSCVTRDASRSSDNETPTAHWAGSVVHSSTLKHRWINLILINAAKDFTHKAKFFSKLGYQMIITTSYSENVLTSTIFLTNQLAHHPPWVK